MRLTNVIIFLLLLNIAFAQSVNVSVSSTTCNNSGDLLAAITNLPQCIAEAIFSTLVSGLVYSAQQFFQTSIGFLTATPDLSWFCWTYNSIITVLESLYTIMLLGLGIHYIIHSTDVEGRTRSKLWFKNIFFMIIALSFSFEIFNFIVDINQYLSTSFYNSASSNIFQINTSFSNVIFALVISISLVTSAALTFFTLIIRYVMIPFLLFLFPIAIFLYFIPLTREWGAFIFKFSVMIIFITTVDSILLLGLSSLFNTPDPNLANTFVHTIALMLSFGLIGLVNLIIFIIAILSVISQAMRAFESVISTVMKVAFIKAFI